MSEPKLFTEAEARIRFDHELTVELRERGLIAPEPVDALLIEAREMLVEDHTKGARSFGWGGTYHKYGAANELIREGKFDSDVGLNQHLRALKRGMELAQPSLTREMVRGAFAQIGWAPSDDTISIFMTALTERQP